ncbi:hypothetical protein NSTC745_01904 [Nostoc sp. DSM 114161]|jgi:uncharacterized membrane protein YeaQ/YmgE (transglycosylase-associated protein family)
MPLITAVVLGAISGVIAQLIYQFLRRNTPLMAVHHISLMHIKA